MANHRSDNINIHRCSDYSYWSCNGGREKKEKLMNISDMVDLSEEDFNNFSENEMKDCCDFLCCNCHHLKTNYGRIYGL